MAQAGYTPVILYNSSTPTNVPNASNLATGELALNAADGKLFYKNTSGVVTTLAGLSGYSGYSGTNGTSGTSGYSGSGISGFSGYSGSGISGYSGATGTGTSGYSGYSGTSVTTSSANTWTATQTFNGTSSTLATVLLDAAETVNIVAASPSATTNFYVNSGAVQYYTTNAANNWTLNIAFSSGTTLNAAMSTGQAVTIAMLATQGTTAYYNSAVTIDGTSVTPRWQSGATPTAGYVSSVNTYTYTIIKTAASTYTILASLTQF